MSISQDEDMYLFQGDLDQTPNAFAGQAFDSFLNSSPATQNDQMTSNGYLDAESLPVKKESGNSPMVNQNIARNSASSDSSSSSSNSPQHHNRNISAATTASSGPTRNAAWGSGINGMSMPANEQYFDDATMSGIDTDFEASAFDFDTAASTPSGYDAATMSMGSTLAASRPLQRTSNMGSLATVRTPNTRMTAAPAAFFIGSREASPLSTMLPTSQAPSPWTKHSPSSGLEETFNHMGMNGDSPGNATFSPNLGMNFNANPFSFDPESSGTPSSFAKDVSSPPSTIHSGDGSPNLHIYPTSLKSRVETQIPIRMTLFPLPPGAKKLRLPTHTVSKPKFLAKPEVDSCQEVLELSVSLVCTSAMQDPAKKQRALARARGEDLTPYARPSPASSTSASSKDDDEKPLNGGEVRICSGCIQRERKRASRKKQKKPEEEEMFQKDEEKRVVVFNTNEIKEWAEITKENQPTPDQGPLPPAGTMQVELPMRIACYCRHQNEKMGFMVIFTVKDYRDRVIAQAMTNSIMITDDHKTHNAPPPMTSAQAAQMPTSSHLPGAGVFSTGGGLDMPLGEPPGAKLFKQSYSTPDLTRLKHSFHPHFGHPQGNPFAVPNMSSATSGTLTPKNLSRPASPTGPVGPATKRRKPSGSGKLPHGLTMTRLDTTPTQPSGATTMPNTAASSPFAPNVASFMSGGDRGYPQPTAQGPNRSQGFGHSPPTPNGADGTFNPAINRSFSLENLPRQALISAPSSRQPSRPGSPIPGSSRNSFSQADANFQQAVTAQLIASQNTRRPPPAIHKLVPAEGSTSGGTEVTLLGNGFYQGLEVMFGDTEATTTTFWGEKCLNCIAPPAVQPGMVAVVFKHEHPHYSTIQSPSHGRPSVFTYVDDREIEMLRLALRTIGKTMGNDDPYTTAQQLIQQSQPHPGSMYQQQPGGYGMGTGLQRSGTIPGTQSFRVSELEVCLLNLLHLTLQRMNGKTAQLHLRRPTGMTLLHLSASLGLTRFTIALLNAGADANVVDKNGLTPMHHAAMNGHEHVIHRLRLAGADHRIQSLRNFVPADLATTAQAHQAIMRPYQHFRIGSTNVYQTQLTKRSASSRSLKSFWDSSSVYYSESESDSSENERMEMADTNLLSTNTGLPFAQPSPLYTQLSVPPSRRGSRTEMTGLLNNVSNTRTSSEQDSSPYSLLNAWQQFLSTTQTQQQQFAEQFHHLQEQAQRVLPALPNIPMPDYQTYPMMRRVSSLFPQIPRLQDARSNSKSESDITSPAPPAYDELYPGRKDEDNDVELKKSSALMAAADAAIDQHYEREISTTNESNNKVKPKLEHSSQVKKVTLKDDPKLFFFWIPLLAIVLALMFKNSSLWESMVSLHDTNRQQQNHERIVEVI